MPKQVSEHSKEQRPQRTGFHLIRGPWQMRGLRERLRKFPEGMSSGENFMHPVVMQPHDTTST
jgi:hypothetical protein